MGLCGRKSWAFTSEICNEQLLPVDGLNDCLSPERVIHVSCASQGTMGWSDLRQHGLFTSPCYFCPAANKAVADSRSLRKTIPTSVLDFFLDRENVSKFELNLSL